MKKVLMIAMAAACAAAFAQEAKKDAKPVGQMSNPDAIGPMIVDRETLFRLMAERRPVSFKTAEPETDKEA